MSVLLRSTTGQRWLVWGRDTAYGVWAALRIEMEAAQHIESFVLETLSLGQQSIIDADEVAALVEASAKRFASFIYFAKDFELEDNFHEAIAHLEGIYSDLRRMCENNRRVADGRGRMRDGDPPDYFIGPTGHIPF